MTYHGAGAAILVCAALLQPQVAYAQSGDRGSSANGDGTIRIGGSVRTVAAAVKPTAKAPAGTPGASAFDETLLRVTLDARPTDRLTFEAHLVQSYTYSSVTSAFGFAMAGGFGLAAGDARYRAIDATADWFPTARQTASLWVDRLNVKIRLPRADLTIGRQAISFGKTYFWNPLDEFLPFDARQVDRDYKSGVDALRADVPIGPFSGVTVVGAAGREIDASGAYHGGDATLEASWYGSAVLGRYFTTLGGWDLATQAGKVYGGYAIGGGAVGEIKHLEVRGEATYLWALPGLPLPAPLSGRLIEDHLSAVAGIGKRFQNTLSFELEHFHNGAGDRQDLDAALLRVASGSALHLSREITGVTVRYEFLPILAGNMATLHSWSDGSTLLQPTLTYSLSENSEVIVGSAVGIGAAPVMTDALASHLRSEFASFPRAVFVEFKFYF